MKIKIYPREEGWTFMEFEILRDDEKLGFYFWKDFVSIAKIQNEDCGEWECETRWSFSEPLKEGLTKIKVGTFSNPLCCLEYFSIKDIRFWIWGVER